MEAGRTLIIRDLNTPEGFILDIARIMKPVSKFVDATVNTLSWVSRVTLISAQFNTNRRICLPNVDCGPTNRLTSVNVDNLNIQVYRNAILAVLDILSYILTRNNYPPS